MRFLIYGEDTYRSKMKLALLRAKFRSDRDPFKLNEHLLQVESANIDAVIEALFSSPFLADRKLVVLENYLSLSKGDQQKLVDLLTGQPDSTVAIFYQSDNTFSASSSPLFNELKNQKYTEEFKLFNAEQSINFIATECHELGVRIERQACQALISAVGASSWALHQEAAKLCAYAKSNGSELVNLAMVKELVSGSIEDRLFDFLDACMQGKAAAAIDLLEHIVSMDTSELQILAMLQRQISSLVGAKDLLDRGVTDRNEVARQLGIHPYPAGKVISAARFASNKHLKALMNELLEIEHRSKTGFGRIKIELGLFTTRMANQRG